MNYVDLHSHLLPALDDGPATFADSTALIEAAWEAGTRRMVATPHMFHGGLGSDNRAEVLGLFADFEARFATHLTERRARDGAEDPDRYLDGFELAPPGWAPG